jgi:hypothetical protein
MTVAAYANYTDVDTFLKAAAPRSRGKDESSIRDVSAPREINIMGLIQTDSSDSNRIMFSPGRECSAWVTIPTRLVASIDDGGQTTCKGQHYQLVRLHLRTSSQEEAALAQIAQELAAEAQNGHRYVAEESKVVRRHGGIPYAPEEARESARAFRAGGPILERVTVQAISRFRVVAAWQGINNPTQTRTTYYTPPPGWFVLSNRVEVHASNNGSRAVGVIGGGLNVISESDARYVYDSAIDFAGETLKDFSLKAKLEQKQNQHLNEIRRVQSNMNTIEATISATPHGNMFDRKRGWEEISVHAEIVRLGESGRADLAASLEAEFGVDIPNLYIPLTAHSGICLSSF